MQNTNRIVHVFAKVLSRHARHSGEGERCVSFLFTGGRLFFLDSFHCGIQPLLHTPSR
jgi:hypothetical protein